MIDAQLVFSDGDGPFSIGTNASSNYLDRLIASDLGRGAELWAVVQILTSVAGSGSTCDIRLVTDDNSSFSSPTTLWSTGALPVSALAAGTVIKFRILPGFERFARFEYVVATANQTAGKFLAYFTTNVDDLPGAPFQRATYALA